MYNLVKRLSICALLALSSSMSWSQSIRLGVERAASASLCPDQKTAQAVVSAHATDGLQAALALYTAKCYSVVVYLVPQAVISRTRIAGEDMKIIRVLIRMADNSQTEWFMLTKSQIDGDV